MESASNAVRSSTGVLLQGRCRRDQTHLRVLWERERSLHSLKYLANSVLCGEGDRVYCSTFCTTTRSLTHSEFNKTNHDHDSCTNSQNYSDIVEFLLSLLRHLQGCCPVDNGVGLPAKEARLSGK